MSMHIAFTLLMVAAGFLCGIPFGIMLHKIVKPYRGRGRLLDLRSDGLPQGGLE